MLSFIERFVPFLLLLLCCAPFQHILAFPSTSNDNLAPVQLRQAVQHPVASKNRNVFPQLTWLRDTAIEKIFGVPPKARKPQGTSSDPKSRPSNAQLPATLLAKYGGDVVLRFNISSADEEAALSEAADTLFLDVWEFADSWADIRLREDDVCLTNYPVIVPRN